MKSFSLLFLFSALMFASGCGGIRDAAFGDCERFVGSDQASCERGVEISFEESDRIRQEAFDHNMTESQAEAALNNAVKSRCDSKELLQNGAALDAYSCQIGLLFYKNQIKAELKKHKPSTGVNLSRRKSR